MGERVFQASFACSPNPPCASVSGFMIAGPHLGNRDVVASGDGRRPALDFSDDEQTLRRTRWLVSLIRAVATNGKIQPLQKCLQSPFWGLAGFNLAG